MLPTTAMSIVFSKKNFLKSKQNKSRKKRTSIGGKSEKYEAIEVLNCKQTESWTENRIHLGVREWINLQYLQILEDAG